MWEELTDEQRYQQLLRQSLIELPKATTSEHPMAALDSLEAYAEQDGRWVPVILSIVGGVPLANPLSSALIAIVADVMPTPSRSDLHRLATDMHTLLHRAQQARHIAQLRNSLITLAVVAARQAGHASTLLFTDDIMVTILEVVESDIDPVVTLSAGQLLEHPNHSS